MIDLLTALALALSTFALGYNVGNWVAGSLYRKDLREQQHEIAVLKYKLHAAERRTNTVTYLNELARIKDSMKDKEAMKCKSEHS